MMAEERRLAITIKGGVSLGAYEAGAIAETLSLIANNNQRRNSRQWYIDVITGASAGAMTAALTAVALIAGPDLQPPNPFYGAWVRDVSVSALLPLAANLNYNLFDARALDRIAARNIRLPLLAPNPHPGLNPSNPLIRIGFTLSRLQTVPLRVDTWAGRLSYKEYADLARFELKIDASDARVGVTSCGVLAMLDAAAPFAPSGNISDINSAWRALVNSAIASGSFPIAFEPRGLRRWEKDRWLDIYYVDGGLYDNDPVGEAINIAHQLDWFDHPSTSDRDRRFLIIHTETSDETMPTLAASDGSLLELQPEEALQKLIGAFVIESQTSGLRGIGPINQLVEKRLEVLAEIAARVALSSTAEKLSPALALMAEACGIRADNLKQFRDWLIPDLQDDAPQLYQKVKGLNQSQQASFVELALLYDLAANLIDKVPLKPILIAPQSNTLSGVPLYGFAGFLDQAFRDHDFKQGAYDAYQAWKQVADATDSHGQPLNEFDLTGAAEPLRPEPSPDLKPESLREYRSELQKFKGRVTAVLDSLATELAAPGGFGSWVEAEVLKEVLAALGNWAINKELGGNS